jgi:hypothetical protein
MSDKDKKVNDIEYKVLAFDAQKTAIERIKKNGSKSIFKIIEDHAEAEEIDRRVNVIKKVITKHNSLKKEIDSIKPDIEGGFNVVGVQDVSKYSPNAWKNKLAKIKELNAIVDAMDLYEKENNFDKLDELGRKQKDA